MGLVLSFRHARRHLHRLGPLASVRLDAGGLRERADGPVLATHADHTWTIAGRSYYRLDCPARVTLHFEDEPGVTRSRDYGPFGCFSAADGIAFAEDRVVAAIDRESLHWLTQLDGNLWGVLVLSEAKAERFDRKLFALGALCLAAQLPGVYALDKGDRLVRTGAVASIAPACGEALYGRSRALIVRARATRARSRDSQSHSAVSRMVSRDSLMRQRAFIGGASRRRRAPRAG